MPHRDMHYRHIALADQTKTNKKNILKSINNFSSNSVDYYCLVSAAAAVRCHLN